MNRPPDYTPCPKCGENARCRIVRERRPKDISLDGPNQPTILVGVYRCKACKKYFTSQPEGLSKRRRYTDRASKKVYDGIVQDKLTFLGSPKRANRDFSIAPSLSTCWRWTQKLAARIDLAREYTHIIVANFSGQLSVDEVKDGKRRMFVATDPLQPGGPVIDYHRGDRANVKELLAFLTKLRDNFGINPIVVNHDDAAIFENAITDVWKDAKPQLCHFHVMKLLSYNYLRNSLQERINSVKPPRHRRYHRIRAYWNELFRRRRLFFKSARNLTKPNSVKHKEAEFVQDACARYPTLATFREFVLDFYHLMDCKDAIAAETLRQEFRKKWAGEVPSDPYFGHVLKRFGDDQWFAKLFAFTIIPNGARTTNSTERANRWFRKRQKSHYRTRSERSTVNLLNADLTHKRESCIS